MYVIFIFLSFFPLNANPFAIDFSPTTDPTNDDYLNVQQQLRTIALRPLLEQMYVPNAGYVPFSDFLTRCSKGISQTLIDPDKDQFPIISCIKIGSGGDSCFVTCIPYNASRWRTPVQYPSLIPGIISELERVGFNGYFLYRVGGFPNPTGHEIQYAGVPYSFKIFMMLEAFQRGFTRVIWLDSAVLPLRNPAPLFDWLDCHDALLNEWFLKYFHSKQKYIFPETYQLLVSLTGTDIFTTTHINTVVFGLKMNSGWAQQLIADYYRMVEMGTPFLSMFPEEFVLSALIHSPKYNNWQSASFRLFTDPCWNPVGESTFINKFRELGYFFYLRPH